MQKDIIIMNRFLITLSLLTACMGMTAQSELTWFDGTHPVTYTVKGREVSPVVATAVKMFSEDMKMVTGMEAVEKKRGGVIEIRQGEGEDDGFNIMVKKGRIVIEGHNARGAAYGVLELSRMAGVSPWVWWGDIVPEQRERLTIDEGFVMECVPSVEYRGIFINDEDWSTRPWSERTFEPGMKGRIGKETYRQIFKLLLRLRGNAIWPAMHEGTVPFFHVEGAKEVADSCGIVIGTSHCEPLLRNNVGEWNVEERGRFNYKTNRQAVQEYWVERLEEVKESANNMFTIGMRGIHDSSMEGYSTEDEKFEGLQEVIDDQQTMLREHVGDPSELTQVFVPYKEVLQLYEKGLKVPDYVTLMWCDDNYGYMTRYSSPSEQERKGGAGVYYHLSYWGRPHDYLWLTTTQPGLIYNEMREAYEHNVRKLWIANVHDVKVAGYDLELFLDMAWDISSVSASTLQQHYGAWLCRQFGREAGERLLPAMTEFWRLCGERRPEFMGWTQVELDKRRYERGLSGVERVGFTKEAAEMRLAAFEDVKRAVGECLRMIRPELGDAYFAAVEYPVFAAAAMNRKILSGAEDSHRAYEEIQALTARYNGMNGEKWRGLMDAAPRRLPVFEDVHATLADSTPTILLCRNAADFDQATDGATPTQMLGHSMNAVALPKGGALTYVFSVDDSLCCRLATEMIPTQAVDGGDIRYSVAIDGQEPVVYSLKEPFRSEEWKQNVLRGQAVRYMDVVLSAGVHSVTITAMDEHIVVDRWKLLLP